MDDVRVGRFTIPDVEIDETFSTSGGPGGQHANRSLTAVELRFDVAASEAFPTSVRDRIIERLGPVVAASSAESRSQWRNRSIARSRLAEAIEEAMTPPTPRRATRPTRASRLRRLDSKRRQSEKKRLRQQPDWKD